MDNPNLYQTRRNNPLVYKGLNGITYFSSNFDKICIKMLDLILYLLFCVIVNAHIVFPFNTFKQYGISRSYQLDPFISVIRVVGWYFLNFSRIFCKQNSGDPGQTPHSAASGLGLHSLPMSHNKDARLIWVNV